jgi:hypothetical protein
VGRNEGEGVEPRLPRGAREHGPPAAGAALGHQSVSSPAMALPELWVLRNVDPLQHLQLLRQGGQQRRCSPVQRRETCDPR